MTGKARGASWMVVGLLASATAVTACREGTADGDGGADGDVVWDADAGADGDVEGDADADADGT